MKKIIMFVMAITITLSMVTFSYAEDKHEKFCSVISSYAESVMDLRQYGIPIMRLIRAINKINDEQKNYEGKENISKYAKKIVYDAYEYPRFSIKENQQEVISEFASKWYLKCMEETRIKGGEVE